jgi:hypothetical protein
LSRFVLELVYLSLYIIVLKDNVFYVLWKEKHIFYFTFV